MDAKRCEHCVGEGAVGASEGNLGKEQPQLIERDGELGFGVASSLLGSRPQRFGVGELGFNSSEIDGYGGGGRVAQVWC